MQVALATLDVLDRKVSDKLATRAFIEKSLQDTKKEIERRKSLISILEKTSALLQRFADAQRREVQERISKVISYGLSVVYETPMRFIIEDEERKNDVSFRFMVEGTVDGEKVVLGNLKDSQGGGLINVVSFLLRVMYILIHPDCPRRIIVADEPFSMLDTKGRTEKLAGLLKDLAAKLDFQFVIVSHQDELCLAADQVHSVDIRNGHTFLRNREA